MNRWHPLPEEVYALVERTPAAVLLECSDPGTAESQTDAASRLFLSPLRICQAGDLSKIPALFAEIEGAIASGFYAAGFFSYECGQCFEPTAALKAPKSGLPLVWFGIYERSYLFNHRTGTFPDGGPDGLAEPRKGGSGAEPSSGELTLEAEFTLTEAEYARRIETIHEWIRAGEIYQLNFTAPFRVHATGSSAALYRRLRSRQPVPYSAFLHWQHRRRILSFSPELFFRVVNDGEVRRIVSKPMKGTAPRGRATGEDRERARWLHNDAKNLSENVMIVDLVRNDLGRLCTFGSVRVRDLFAVERYPTVWQMTSTVTGELRPEVGYHEIFRALFPCGSITGAPKVRAMQLAARIEDEPRGVYTGAIGFFSPRETVFNVAIRTLELDGDEGTMGVGGGIVIDSNTQEEFNECLLKAEFLAASAARWPERFLLIESLLWKEGYPLIELHLDRFENSADYFGFACDREAARVALLNYAREFGDAKARKVRLLLDRDGALQIASEVLPGAAGSEPAARVRIAPQRTDPHDRMLFHKTTHRTLYNEAFKAAAEAGFDEVLFVNLRGEVTEGAISNVFIEKDGLWMTPPIECGVLAGVYRRQLLETRPEIQERVLSLDDLRGAAAVYICNAVRGMRQAEIDWEV